MKINVFCCLFSGWCLTDSNTYCIYSLPLLLSSQDLLFWLIYQQSINTSKSYWDICSNSSLETTSYCTYIACWTVMCLSAEELLWPVEFHGYKKGQNKLVTNVEVAV